MYRLITIDNEGNKLVVQYGKTFKTNQLLLLRKEAIRWTHIIPECKYYVENINNGQIFIIEGVNK